MNKKLSLFAFLFLSLCVTIYAKNSLHVTPSEYYFGSVPRGSIVEGELTLINDGASEVEFFIRSTCDCLTVASDSGSVQSHGQLSIFYQFNTLDYDGPIEQGLSIYEKSNAGNLLYFTLSGIVTDGKRINKNRQKTVFDYSTWEYASGIIPDNEIAFFSYKNCRNCISIYKELGKWAKDNDYTAKFYALDDARNAKKLVEITDTIGDFPELPIILAQEHVFAGKNGFKDLVGKSRPFSDRKLRTLNWFSLFLVGLLDGVNPCAFTVIILLISYLTLNLKEINRVFSAGLIYVITVFLTYFAIGLGFLEIIRKLQFFSVVSMIFRYALSAALLVMAVLSVYDAIKARQGKEKDILLQLPAFFKNKIRQNIREKTKTYKIVLTSIFLGFFVSLFELVCTGQVYVPVLAYMVRMNEERVHGTALLLLYNFGFILPLLLIFFLVYKGVSSAKIGEVLKKRITLIKFLFAGFFIIFAGLNLVF